MLLGGKFVRHDSPFAARRSRLVPTGGTGDPGGVKDDRRSSEDTEHDCAVEQSEAISAGDAASCSVP
ncbi:MAG: hypothetical protein M1121_06645, partial [Actinobacteria bacterium]|nr:hypothetical protein [Actinomycetota bacterium]